jgi:hypothetical protein
MDESGLFVPAFYSQEYVDKLKSDHEKAMETKIEEWRKICDTWQERVKDLQAEVSVLEKVVRECGRKVKCFS